MANGRIPRGVLQRLSKKAEKPVAYLSDMANGHKRAGRNMAQYLEGKTGIDAATWAFGSSEKIKSAIIEQFSE